MKRSVLTCIPLCIMAAFAWLHLWFGSVQSIMAGQPDYATNAQRTAHQAAVATDVATAWWRALIAFRYYDRCGSDERSAEYRQLRGRLEQAAIEARPTGFQFEIGPLVRREHDPYTCPYNPDRLDDRVTAAIDDLDRVIEQARRR